MNKETLKKLLHEACEILIIYEDSGNAPQEILERIDALFNEIKYSDYLDSEIKADQEAQDWDTFNKNKI